MTEPRDPYEPLGSQAWPALDPAPTRSIATDGARRSAVLPPAVVEDQPEVGAIRGPLLSGLPQRAPAFESASLWRRALAAALDLLVPFATWALATWAIIASDPEPLAMPQWNLFDQVVDYLHDRPGRALASLGLFVVLQILWPVAFATRTPGKRALGIALVTSAGDPPSRLRTLGWAVLRLPSILLAGGGVWWVIVDPERRALHDRLAGMWSVVAKH